MRSPMTQRSYDATSGTTFLAVVQLCKNHKTDYAAIPLVVEIHSLKLIAFRFLVHLKFFVVVLLKGCDYKITDRKSVV